MCDENGDVGFTYSDWLRFKDVENGVVRLDGEVDQYTVSMILSELNFIVRSKKWNEITLIISSEGGTIYDAFALYDVLKQISKSGIKITAVVQGWAASAASMIVLQAADVRRAMASSRFLLHEPSRWTVGSEKVSEGRDDLKEIEKLADMILNVLASRCHHTPEKIKKFIERRDVWMSAEEALAWGLIDEVQ
jgi:ATP-dependent Clp protease protease subunit